VLFSRFGDSGAGWEDGPEGIGIHPPIWPNSVKEGFSWNCKDTLVRTHDWYDVPSFLSIPEKLTRSREILLPPPNNPPVPVLSIAFFSAASFPLALPPTIANGLGWPEWGLGIEGVNSRVGRWLLSMLGSTKETSAGPGKSHKHDISDTRIRGWAFMDFFAQSEDPVVPLLVECNYQGRRSGEEGW